VREFHKLVLNTERLVLRPLAARDVSALFALFSDNRVMRYWSSGVWTSEETARTYIAGDAKAMRKGEHLRLGIEIRASSQMVGMCTLYDFMRQCRRAEIGYAVSSAFWGQGYMLEALAALLDFGFGELDLHRVEADVDPRNHASVRLLERLGFVKEGFLRERWIVDGEICDTGFYGLLRSEWRERAERKAGGLAAEQSGAREKHG
jgi:RimJ/RimL family protein N-acetyltransferase